MEGVGGRWVCRGRLKIWLEESENSTKVDSSRFFHLPTITNHTVFGYIIIIIFIIPVHSLVKIMPFMASLSLCLSTTQP